LNTARRAFLRGLYDAAVEAVSAAASLPAHLPPRPRGRAVVLGAGKAAAEMARVVEQCWERPPEGLVVTRYGHGAPCSRIEVVEAAHPLPDEAGVEAARRTLALARASRDAELVLCLLSGGGSALLALPAQGISLADKRAIGAELLRSGATIGEINCVRKHLSAIKGGRLALACAPARVLTLAISDVTDDDRSVIASGPTVPDATTSADALRILRRYGVALAPHVAAHLRTVASETPKPGDARFARARFEIVASARVALVAAAERAAAAGVATWILDDRIDSEAREAAATHAEAVRQVMAGEGPVDPPCVLLSGGETTVTVRGRGRGGRNTEFLLALAVELDGTPGIEAIACDTDGIDGTEDNAGAIMSSDTAARARAAGLDARAALAENDSYGFFAALGDLVVTGPTRTNVNDFRAILVG
jgi:hydroxypyruvate reductase